MATKAKSQPVPAETNGAGVHIAELIITDFLQIRFRKIDEPGKLVVISGDNATGKTSTIRAIQELLKPSGAGIEVIHDDSERAELYARFTDGVEAKRIRTRKSERLDLRKGDEPISKPQTYLDELAGSGPWFDVLEFAFAKPRERREQLLGALDIKLSQEFLAEALGENFEFVRLEDENGSPRFDWSKNGLVLLSEIRDQVYERRAEVNRDVTRMAKSIEQDRQDIGDTGEVEEFGGFDPKATRDAHAAAMEKVAEAEAAIKEDATKRGKLQLLQDRNKKLVEAGQRVENDIQAEIERHARQMERLQAEVDRLKTERERLIDEGVQLRAEVDAFEAPDVDSLRAAASELSAKLDRYDQFVEVGVALKNIKRKEEELALQKDFHARLDETHKLLVDAVPIKLMQSVDMPVEGLTIDDEDIRINGRRMENQSDGERMMTAMEIAVFLQRDRKFKVILVNGVERIVGEMYERFISKAKELSKKHDVQFWITRTEPHEYAITKELEASE